MKVYRKKSSCTDKHINYEKSHEKLEVVYSHIFLFHLNSMTKCSSYSPHIKCFGMKKNGRMNSCHYFFRQGNASSPIKKKNNLI